MTNYIICIKGVREIQIYLDVYFFYNFILDFCILFVVRNVLKIKKSVIRLFFSAAFGSLYAVTQLFLPHIMIIGALLTYIISLEFMVLIAFGKVEIRENIKIVLFIYLVAFVLNGIINAFHIGNHMWKVLIIVFAVCSLLIVGVRRIFEILEEQAVMYIIKITEEDNTISVKALKDTGNHLIDPQTKKPVSIIEKDVINKLISEKTKIIYVPYKSVGKNHGMMKACIVEQLEVEGRKYKNAVIGLFEGNLSKNNEYNMILHPKLFEPGGEEFD